MSDTFDLIRASRNYEIIHDIVSYHRTQKQSPFITYPTQLREHPISQTYSRLEGLSIFYDYVEHSPITNIIIDGIHVYKYVHSKGYRYSNCYTPSETIFCIDPIIEMATPSKFGQGSETNYDESIRKGKEISANRIEIEYNNLMDVIWSQIKKLTPAGKKLKPKLYKMHIYEKGGLFMKHRDTLHAPNHFATLIIGINNNYSGGNLIIDDLHQNIQHEIKFNSKSQYDKDFVHFAIFTTDSYHQVTEVTDGVRVVLQYDLYLEENESENSIRDSDNDNSSESENENNMISEPLLTFDRSRKLETLPQDKILSILEKEINNFYQNNPKTIIYFLLSHAYPIGLTFDLLKDKDRQLYELLLKHYSVKLGIAFHCYYTEHDGTVTEEEKSKLCVIGLAGQKAAQHYIETGQKPLSAIQEDAVVFFPISVKFNFEECRNYVEYTGNEAAPGYYAYQTMVLAIEPKN